MTLVEIKPFVQNGFGALVEVDSEYAADQFEQALDVLIETPQPKNPDWRYLYGAACLGYAELLFLGGHDGQTIHAYLQKASDMGFNAEAVCLMAAGAYADKDFDAVLRMWMLSGTQNWGFGPHGAYKHRTYYVTACAQWLKGNAEGARKLIDGVPLDKVPNYYRDDFSTIRFMDNGISMIVPREIELPAVPLELA